MRRGWTTEELTAYLKAGNESARKRMARKRQRERDGVLCMSPAPITEKFADHLLSCGLISYETREDAAKVREALKGLWPDLLEELEKALRATRSGNGALRVNSHDVK